MLTTSFEKHNRISTYFSLYLPYSNSNKVENRLIIKLVISGSGATDLNEDWEPLLMGVFLDDSISAENTLDNKLYVT